MEPGAPRRTKRRFYTFRAAGRTILIVFRGGSRQVSGMSLTVLVVDDQETVLNVLGLFIGRRGHRVIPANSGKAAIEQMNTQAVDAALIDVHMPNMNGFETAEALLGIAQARGRPLPLWFMTGARTSAAEKRAAAMGAAGLLAKPFDHEALLSELDRFDRPGKPGGTSS